MEATTLFSGYQVVCGVVEMPLENADNSYLGEFNGEDTFSAAIGGRDEMELYAFGYAEGHGEWKHLADCGGEPFQLVEDGNGGIIRFRKALVYHYMNGILIDKARAVGIPEAAWNAVTNAKKTGAANLAKALGWRGAGWYSVTEVRHFGWNDTDKRRSAQRCRTARSFLDFYCRRAEASRNFGECGAFRLEVHKHGNAVFPSAYIPKANSGSWGKEGAAFYHYLGNAPKTAYKGKGGLGGVLKDVNNRLAAGESAADVYRSWCARLASDAA